MNVACTLSGVKSQQPNGDGGGRVSIGLELTRAANKKLDELADDLGMKKKILLSRMVEWFAVQHEGLQKMAAGRTVAGYEVETLRMVIAEMEKQAKPKKFKGVLTDLPAKQAATAHPAEDTGTPHGPDREAQENHQRRRRH
jgi:hypothetical protein